MSWALSFKLISHYTSVMNPFSADAFNYECKMHHYQATFLMFDHTCRIHAQWREFVSRLLTTFHWGSRITPAMIGYKTIVYVCGPMWSRPRRTWELEVTSEIINHIHLTVKVLVQVALQRVLLLRSGTFEHQACYGTQNPELQKSFRRIWNNLKVDSSVGKKVHEKDANFFPTFASFSRGDQRKAGRLPYAKFKKS